MREIGSLKIDLKSDQVSTLSALKSTMAGR
jgi:hypothetical protein